MVFTGFFIGFLYFGMRGCCCCFEEERREVDHFMMRDIEDIVLLCSALLCREG